MNGTNEWFPISKVSSKVNIPPETIRRYARQYGNFLVMKRGEKKAYLIHESSFETIKQIRSLLEQGHQHEQVKSMLSQSKMMHFEWNKERQEVTPVESNTFKEMMKEIRELREQNTQLMELLNQVRERMDRFDACMLQEQAATFELEDEQDNEQREYERKRDEYLMQTMNDLQEKKRGNSSTHEKKKLFAKLFKK